MKITVGHASIPKDGFAANGDAVFVRSEGPRVLVVVIDALGHGPAAAGVSAAAIDALEKTPHATGVHEVVDRVHAQLRGGRGAAALFLLLDAGPAGADGAGTASYEICSVGNVEARARPAKVPLVLTPGVLGLRLRVPRIIRGELPAGTRVLVFTDGVSGRIDVTTADAAAPEAAATLLVKRHRREHDDATVAIIDVDR